MNRCKKRQEINRQIGVAPVGMLMLYRTVVIKKELSWKAKLLICQSVYASSLIYGQELWVVTERIRS